MRISKDKYAEMQTRIEIAERFVMDLPLADQKRYMDCLDTWGAFSREVYQNVKDVEQTHRDVGIREAI